MYRLEKEKKEVLKCYKLLESNKLDFCSSLYVYKRELEKQRVEIKEKGMKNNTEIWSSKCNHWNEFCSKLDIPRLKIDRFITVGRIMEESGNLKKDMKNLSYSCVTELASMSYNNIKKIFDKGNVTLSSIQKFKKEIRKEKELVAQKNKKKTKESLFIKGLIDELYKEDISKELKVLGLKFGTSMRKAEKQYEKIADRFYSFKIKNGNIY
ncbi:MAG: hypothetical protein ACRC0G_10040, partial [Fusobacteriaceae bacterium]